MKKLHLLCNAHLDPAWLWRWNEGLAEAISTFRVAADFCEKYDNFIFNHNEALLYEWIEEHDPQLFERIKKLVQQKKWIIMGGWYLQPDCVMTSGESLLSQIRLGNEYFEKKFGIKPETAINFDPFGHSRGIVQILNKTGYKNYIFMRPETIPVGDFLWEGFDGSKIVAHKVLGNYGTLKGQARKKVEDCIKANRAETDLVLWGIGNHGGGPSKIDLESINNLIETSDIEIIHSSADDYFRDINTENLPTVSRSLIPCMVGCYTSMVRIKQAHRRLENKIAMTEKIMSYSEILHGAEFDEDALKQAKKALAFCQFHDILPGSGIKPVEEDGLRYMNYGEEIADKLFTKAFLKMCATQKKAKDGEIPIMVFNPHPYEIDGEFEIGFMLQNQNWNEDEITLATVHDDRGNPLPTQNEKPECTFNLDWIQKICFKGKLAPSSITRFDCTLTVTKKDEIQKPNTEDEFITVENPRMKVSISKKTGLIATFELDGIQRIQNSGILEVYKDNEDPWGMTVDSFRNFENSFSLMSDQEANSFLGYPQESTPNVRIVEDGAVRTKIQAFFRYNRSVAMVEYTLPKLGAYMDIDIRMLSNEPNKMIKYRIDSQVCGVPYGETAFGFEPLFDDEREAVFHKWCGLKNENGGLFVLNKGTYGGSFTPNSIKLSLLRTPVYATHPIEQRQLAPHDRFLNHIDMGERHFSFRITNNHQLARQAQIYSEEPLLLSFFPSGDGNKSKSVVTIDNDKIILSSFRKTETGYEMCLYNSSENEVDAEIRCDFAEKEYNLHFGKHEIKFLQTT